MQICPGCGEENPEKFRVCGFCGTPLAAAEPQPAEPQTVVCPSCGEANPAKFRLCGFCGAELSPAPPAQEVRKTVTIVFSDLKGSTAMGEKLDSEAVREVMSRYFDEMRGALEQHGGTIEKYIGDAIMAVFGLPRLHEDDALRAVRAAAEMRDRLAALNEELERRWGVTIGNRTGVNTGEVVAGDPSTGQRLVTGDTVNTAARLEQAAPTNEVLLGEATYRLVRHAAEVTPVEPLDLKGKAERVPAYQLISVGQAESVERRHDRPIVGRERELSLLLDELKLATDERTCRLVTVLAQAGVGKSRLVEEFARRSGVRIVRGRCLSYGRGITFWPLVELVRDLAGVVDDDSPDEALAKLGAIAGADGAEALARVASVVGLSDSTYPLDEVTWGTRKLLEIAAAGQPLVVYLDDIHWAELAFLDLVEHVATRASGAPLLLLCAARPTLLELRPDWGGTSFDLHPLSVEESGRVVDQLLGDAPVPAEIRERIVTSAEGNPLFVEQLLSMLIDEGRLRAEGNTWVAEGDLATLSIPGTIQALLSARLDMLSARERSVIEPASAIGLLFERAAVEELAPDQVKPEVEAHLRTMTRKQLVRAEAAEASADYRFHHILIRDAAYHGILKRARATFHERFADWAERVNRERNRETEFEEILGYHLEQARTYLSELGPLDDHALELGRRAASHLAAAGRRAFARGDMGAAANLLHRAATLLPERSPERLALLPSLGEAMMETAEFASAEAFLDEAVEGATAAGDERLRADALLTRLLARHHIEKDLGAWCAEVEQTTEEVIPRLVELKAYAELAMAWRMVAWLHAPLCRWAAAAEAQQRALEYARLAGDVRLEARMSSAYANSLCDGPTPVETAIERCEKMLERGLGHGQSLGVVLNSLAGLVALNGDFERARQLYRQARNTLEDVGASVLAASTSFWLARVELLAGQPNAAETVLRNDYHRLQEMGEVFFRTTVGAMLAQAVYAQGRIDEAEALAVEVHGFAASDDIEVDSICRSVKAKVLARRGETLEAVRLAEEAVALIPGAEAPVMQMEALLDLAEVFVLAKDVSRARRTLDRARDLAVMKAMAVPLARVDALIGGLGREAAQAV